MRITWYGTASILLESGADRVLIDPFVPLRGAEISLPVSAFDGVRTIFVTHGHLDHIASLPEICRRNPESVVWCTDTPYRTLLRKGVPEKQLRRLAFGQETAVGGLTLRTWHGRHAVLPKATLRKIASFFRTGNLTNLPYLLREHLACPEADETVLYTVAAEGRTIAVMGSLNLREEVPYPTGCDALILPYNGWDDCLPPAVSAIERLAPKRVLLDHYDDTFPPLTGAMDLAPIMAKYPSRVAPLHFLETVDL